MNRLMLCLPKLQGRLDMADQGTTHGGHARAAWWLLTGLINLLVDKGIILNEDAIAIAEAGRKEFAAKTGPYDQEAAEHLRQFRDTR